MYINKVLLYIKQINVYVALVNRCKNILRTIKSTAVQYPRLKTKEV